MTQAYEWGITDYCWTCILGNGISARGDGSGLSEIGDIIRWWIWVGKYSWMDWLCHWQSLLAGKVYEADGSIISVFESDSLFRRQMTLRRIKIEVETGLITWLLPHCIYLPLFRNSCDRSHHARHLRYAKWIRIRLQAAMVGYSAGWYWFEELTWVYWSNYEQLVTELWHPALFCFQNVPEGVYVMTETIKFVMGGDNVWIGEMNFGNFYM